MIGESAFAARIMRRWFGVLVVLGYGELYDMYTILKISIFVVTFAHNVFNNLLCTSIIRIQLAISLSKNIK